MSPRHGEEEAPDLLRDVAERLREERPELGSLELDRIKLRAMGGARRSTPSTKRGLFVRSRLVVLLTVAMLAVGTGSAMAGIFFNFGGGFCGFLDYLPSSGAQYKIPPPCKEKYEWVVNKCVLGPPGHYWHYILGFCWIPNGHGGWTWGFGSGWLWE